MEEAVERVIERDRRRRATTSARSPCSRPRSRTASRATCTSRRSAARWSSPSWSRSSDGHAPADDEPPRHDDPAIAPAVWRRAPVAAPAPRRLARRGALAGRDRAARPGAVLLIALALPGDGRLTDWVRDAIVPFFGAGRYLLPFVLLLSGWYVEWGPGKELGAPWGRTLARHRRRVRRPPRHHPAHRPSRRRAATPAAGSARSWSACSSVPGPSRACCRCRRPTWSSSHSLLDRPAARIRHAAAPAARAVHVGRAGP